MKWMMMKIEYLNLIHYFADGVVCLTWKGKSRKMMISQIYVA
jgi:hypothetical protein